MVGSTYPSPAAPTGISASQLRFKPRLPPFRALKDLVARIQLPGEGLKQFLTTLRQVVDDLGTAHPELLRVVLPYREYINGEEGLNALERNLEDFQPQPTETQSCDAS